MGPHYLDKLFAPRSIALVGASDKPKTLGKFVYDNLLAEGFPGPIYPVNPKYDKLGEAVCYASLEAIHDPVDLVVIATPANSNWFCATVTCHREPCEFRISQLI